MTPTNRPQLCVIAGPNGAGKTTLTKRWIAGRVPIVKPDGIATHLPRKDGRLDEREAGAAALAQRAQLIADRQTFATETTLAGHSTLTLMKNASAAGFKVNLVFIGVDDPALCLARVADRVLAGGHDVPPNAIVRRFNDALKKIGLAFDISDRVLILDNSGQRRQIVLIHEAGRPRFISKNVPEWVRQALPQVAWPTTDNLIPFALIAHNARDIGR